MIFGPIHTSSFIPRVLPGAAALLAVVLLLITACSDLQDDSDERASLSVAEAMTGDTTGYARVEGPREFDFPEDHGPHPAYKTEWWYMTGNLTAEDGRRYGYQFTIFRTALAPPAHQLSGETDGWRADQFYMGHIALSDIDGEQHFHAERFSRGSAGLAGAQAVPFRVWLEDWSAEAPPGDEPFPMRVRAADGDIALDLTLRPQKPKVFQGEDGFSQKGPGAGNASYYYSYTRLETEGEIRVDGSALEVKGLSWMDREWSTSALGEDQVGWDWFSLQLEDGRDLMYYQMRSRDGTADPHSKGIVVEADGGSTLIQRGDVELTVRDRWESPLGGTYPVAWRLAVPSADLDLQIDAFFPEQEMDVVVRYWEGAVEIGGTSSGEPVDGRGFVEMTGYGDQPGRIVP